MRILFLLLFFFTSSVLASETEFDSKTESILSLSGTDMEGAIKSAKELVDEVVLNGSDEEIVQSNFTLAYLLDENGDYGKAIIYYLEAIRYAEDSNYDEVNNTLISLYKNCGVIFRMFSSYDLSIDYYERGIQLASEISNENQIVSINYNLAGVYLDKKELDFAAQILEYLLERDVSNKRRFNILNRLSYIYMKQENYDKATFLFDEIIEDQESPKKLVAYAYHNKGVIEKQLGNHHKAESYFNSALVSIKGKTKINVASEFKIHFDLAVNYVEWGKYDKAFKAYANAESLIDQITQHPEYFEIYKHLADLYFEQSQYQESKKYEDMYAKSLNDYLKLQEEIQQTDKRYNMDLITKRYFDEVAKQEKISSILLYSKLVSGTLLCLLLLSVGFNWYQKVRLRRSIAQDLMDLKIIR